MIWPFIRKHRLQPHESVVPDSTVKSGTDQPPEVTFNGRMARVSFPPSKQRGERTRGFFGPFAKSPNGRFLLVWQDADPTGSVGGYRDSGEGEFLLFDEERLVVEGRMERPNDGRVANDGTFILSDWRFGSGLRSTFFAFDRTGKTLLGRKFGANAAKSDLSSDGRFAVYMTAGGDHPDANKLTLFDLENGEDLWSKWPESGVPDAIEFKPSEALILFVYKNKGRYAYSMTNGDFLDRDRWETERVDWAGAFELSRIGRERLDRAGDALDLQGGAEIAFILKKAIATGIEEYPSEHAKVLRALGELWERLGDDAEALRFYEQADATYDKSGVKRRIASLRKRLARLRTH